MHSLRSFTFFLKERCILLRSLYVKECSVLSVFYVLDKRMWRSLCSFTFFIKERCPLFGFISHTKMTNLAQKNNVKERSIRFTRLKKNLTFFFQYMYIYIYIHIYTYICLYISIYLLYIHLYIFIEKKNKGWACILFKRTQRSRILLRSFQKNETFLCSFAFFIKRTLRSLLLLRSL